MNHRFRPLTEKDVYDFYSWRYSSPYDVYNYDEGPSDDEVTYYLDPHYRFHVMVDDNHRLVALCSFGKDGQVPGGDYGEDAIDIGMGLRPELTGQGNGTTYIRHVIDFALVNFRPAALRVTIAEFNVRAQKVWKAAGFQEISRFARERDGMPFIVYIRNYPENRL